MIALLRVKCDKLTFRLSFCVAYEKYKQDILRSQFHIRGHQHFPKSKWMNRNINNNIVEIDKVLLDLQKLRIPLLGTTSGSFSSQMISSLPQESQVQKYFKTYLKLIVLLRQSKFNEQWYYQLVGWYNIQSFLVQICQKLFLYQNKNQHMILVQSITWMNPHLFIANPKMQLYEVKKQQKNIQDYYKKLNLSHSIAFLQKVQSILTNTHNQYKSKYYCKYIHANLEKLFKKINRTHQQQINDIFWLIKTYFNTFNDHQSVINAFEQFLIQQTIQLSEGNRQDLIQIYSNIGNMNPKVYEAYIKQFINSSLDSPIQKVIGFFQFLIESEIDDSETLNQLLKRISLSEKQSQIDDYLKHKVHYLLHYLSIKGQKYQISIQFYKKLSQCCRDYEGNGEIARMMAIELDEKGRKEGKEYFSSECLRRNRLNAPIKQDKAQTIKALPQNYKKYQNIRFCTINISTCIINVETKQNVILERDFKKFNHSGKFNRKQQIRDTILRHYGFKINYMEAKEYTKNIRINKEENDDQQ